VKFKGNKYAEFSSFLILLKKCGKKSDSKFENPEKIYKGFPCKKKLTWEFFVK